MEGYHTIAIFTYPSEYAVLRLLLEQQEVRHVFLNETMIGVLPFHSNAIGGIRIKVHPEDIPLAAKIIDHLNNSVDLRIV